MNVLPAIRNISSLLLSYLLNDLYMDKIRFPSNIRTTLQCPMMKIRMIVRKKAIDESACCFMKCDRKNLISHHVYL